MEHTHGVSVALFAETVGWIVLVMVIFGVLYKILLRFFNHMNRNDQAAYDIDAANFNDDRVVNQKTDNHGYVQVAQYI